MGFFLPLGVSLPPMGAAAAMAFSSVSVVTSSLALKWWVRPVESLMPGESVQHETMFDSARETVRDAWEFKPQSYGYSHEITNSQSLDREVVSFWRHAGSRASCFS
ncbi:hypothetical protein VTO73DRAFT_2751 [Trametes versicolor]